MKRNFLALLISVVFLSMMTACVKTDEIEASKLITACFAKIEEDHVSYMFYVSVPDGENSGSENGSKASGGKTFEFKADNFSQALNIFRNSTSGKIDTGHLSLFAGNPRYFELCFKNDSKYIRNEIKTTPAMYYCISEDADALFEYISSECRGNPALFSKDLFENKNKYLACTATELYFSSENKYYTAPIPIVEISSGDYSPVATHTGVYVHSGDSGMLLISGSDYEIYKICRKKMYLSEKLYYISVYQGKLDVTIDGNIGNCEEIAEFSGRCALMGIDILNCIYFCKNKFLTYSSYKEYADKISAQNLKFVCGGATG